MRDILTWNLYLGRWSGTPVRLHVSLLLMIALVWHAAHLSDPQWPVWFTASLSGMLLVAIVIQEAARVHLSQRLVGGTQEILLWPLGGLASVPTAREPRTALLIAAAGPLANLLVASLTVPALIYLKRGIDFWSLLNPFTVPLGSVPIEAAQGGPALVALLFWASWSLAIANLLPAFPLAGARMLHALLWMAMGQRGAMLAAARVGQLAAIWLWILAWLLPQQTAMVATFPLLVLGTLLFFASRQELQQAEAPAKDETSFGYDFSQGYTSLERSEANRDEADAGPVQRWLEERREARAERQRQLEAEEERRVDDILVRLHERGFEQLSAEDRLLLDRVSARYRNRQGH